MSKQEWDQYCDQVKASFNGDYPTFWYEDIIEAGVARDTALNWGDDGEIIITAIS